MKTALLAVLGALILTPSAFANPAEDKRDGLETLWPKFKAAWNKKNIPNLLKLHHPDSPMRADYSKHRKRITAELKGLIENVGTIEGSHVESFVKFRDRFIVNVRYAKEGWVLGTFCLSKDKNDHWPLMEVYINGGKVLLNEIEELKETA